MKKLICLVLAVMLALSAVSAFAAEYKDKDTVKKVQQALNDAGYDCGTPDGAAGKKTKAAITSYQTDKGLTVTGMIDDELLAALGLAEAEADEEAPAKVEAAEAENVEVGVEYSFQGIPWGVTLEECSQKLVENGLLDENSGRYYPLSHTVCIPNLSSLEVGSDGMGITHYYNSVIKYDDIGTVLYCEKTSIMKAIGGYELEQIELGFLPEVSEQQVSDALSLESVAITFGRLSDNEAHKTMYKDLESKIVEAYGESSLLKMDVNAECQVWLGSNNTAILLMVPKFDKDYIAPCTLIYGKTDAYLIAQEIASINEANKTPVADAGL